MVTIEQIDEFRKRTNSSYEDARFFLERHQGDVLEAIIDFEKAKGTGNAQARTAKKGDFGRKIVEIIQKGFDLRMTVEDKLGKMLFTVPILVLLLLTPVWPMILIACLGLIFLGYKLGFRDIKTPSVDMKSIFENLGSQFQDIGRQHGSPASQPKPQDSPYVQDPKVYQPMTQPMTTPPAQTWQAASPQPAAGPVNSGVEKLTEDGFKEFTVE